MRPKPIRLFTVIAALVSAFGLRETNAQCEPGWVNAFSSSLRTPAGARIVGLDRLGTREMYLIGGYTGIDGRPFNGLAQRVGDVWEPMPNTTSLSEPFLSPNALGVDKSRDDHPLIAFGSRLQAGGNYGQGIFRLERGGWTDIGAPFGTRASWIRDFVSYDRDGPDGPASPVLVALGSFVEPNGVTVFNIAQWNGQVWETLGAGLDYWALAAAPFDPDGSGPQGTLLVVAGLFSEAGAQPAQGLATWDGTRWRPINTGSRPHVLTMDTYDEDGPGPLPARLFLGGVFDEIGGVAMTDIARWDGTKFTAVGGGMGGWFAPNVDQLEVHDDGTGPRLYATGAFREAGGVPAGGVASWDGTRWRGVGQGFTRGPTGYGTSAYSLASFDGALYAASGFSQADGGGPVSLAKWDGADWTGEPLNPGEGIEGEVYAFARFPMQGKERVFALGDFMIAGKRIAGCIAWWDGAAWHPLPHDIEGHAFAFHHAIRTSGAWTGSSQPSLVVSGYFWDELGIGAAGVARWDGTAWHRIGQNVHSRVYQLAEYGTGAGAELFALSDGPTLPEAHPYRVAITRFDGAEWSIAEAGIVGETWGLASLDLDGEGPAQPRLFTTVTPEFEYYSRDVMEWNGSSWVHFGTRIAGEVSAMEAHNDGTGTAFYASGEIPSPPQYATTKVIRWRGNAWEQVGEPFAVDLYSPGVYDLRSWDNGTRRQLVAVGRFDRVGSVAARNVAVWDGSTWRGLDQSPQQGPTYASHVFAAPFRENEPFDSLWFGAYQSDVAGIWESRGVAVWRPRMLLGDLNSDDRVDSADLTLLLGRFGVSASERFRVDINGDGAITTTDLVKLIARFGASCP